MISSATLTQRLIIGIAGGSAAGKTTLCQSIQRQMNFDKKFKVGIVSQDSFYKDLDTSITDPRQFNFDHPNALDFDLAFQKLYAIKNGQIDVQIPQYSFIENRRLQTTTSLPKNANIIFFEGLMAFHDERIRNLMTYKIFLHCDDDVRLCRRLKRDTKQRGRSIQSILNQYNKFVKPSFRDFVLPTIVHADLVIPTNKRNRISINLIVQHIKNTNRHMNFKINAIKTKTYCFGENQFYDLQYLDPQTSSISISSSSVQSFLVFPTSAEHKSQLDFFMSRLLSQSITYAYYCEIFQKQWMKIMKHLFKQLLKLRALKGKKYECALIYEMKQILMANNEAEVKVLLFPFCLDKSTSTTVLTRIKKYLDMNPKLIVVILNLCCQINFPSLIYQLRMQRTILLNLYVITNQSRFKEVIGYNAKFSQNNFNWLENNYAMFQQALQKLETQKDDLNSISYNHIKNRYIYQIQQQRNQKKSQQQKKQISSISSIQKFENIIQIPVFRQEHNNLCGYHVLFNLLEFNQNKLQQSNLQRFLHAYYDIRRQLISNQSLSKYLETSCFQSLQRQDLKVLISTRKQIDLKNTEDSDEEQQQQNSNSWSNKIQSNRTGFLSYCLGYIQNDGQELDHLQNLIQKYKNKQYEQVNIILGTLDHYSLVILKNDNIYYFDSNNLSLKEMLSFNYKPEIMTPKLKRTKAVSEAIAIIQQLCSTQKTIFAIAVEKKIQEIVGSYKDFTQGKNAEQLKEMQQKWFNEEYPPQVIQNDLLKDMRKLKSQQLEKKILSDFTQWSKEQFVYGKLRVYLQKNS